MALVTTGQQSKSATLDGNVDDRHGEFVRIEDLHLLLIVRGDLDVTEIHHRRSRPQQDDDVPLLTGSERFFSRSVIRAASDPGGFVALSILSRVAQAGRT